MGSETDLEAVGTPAGTGDLAVPPGPGAVHGSSPATAAPPPRSRLHGAAYRTFGGLPRDFWFLWSGTLVNRLGTFVEPFLALYLTHERGLSVSATGLVLALLGVGGFISQGLGGTLADRIGRRPTLAFGMFSAAAAMLLLGFARALPLVIVVLQPLLAGWLGRLPRVPLLAASQLVMGLGFGLNTLATTTPAYAGAVVVWTLGEIAGAALASSIVADLAPPALRGRYSGMYGMSFGAAAILAPVLGTTVFDLAGAVTLWAGCAALGVVVATGTLMLGPAIHTRAARSTPCSP